MRYFNEDFLQFFRELAANNHKDWFDAHRRRYQKSVKEPFENFIADLIGELKKREENLDLKPGDAIFRINRDIRFSEDKSPYKLDRSAVISPKGRKDHGYPGFFLSFGPEHCRFGGGSYSLGTQELNTLRQYIAGHYQEFKDALNAPSFQEKYGEIRGEEAKRISRELGVYENMPLLYRKQYYYMQELPPEVILQDDLMEISLQYYEAALAVREFLRRGLISSY